MGNACGGNKPSQMAGQPKGNNSAKIEKGDNTPSANEDSSDKKKKKKKKSKADKEEPVNNELNVVLRTSADPESGKTGEIENEGENQDIESVVATESEQIRRKARKRRIQEQWLERQKENIKKHAKRMKSHKKGKHSKKQNTRSQQSKERKTSSVHDEDQQHLQPSTEKESQLHCAQISAPNRRSSKELKIQGGKTDFLEQKSVESKELTPAKINSESTESYYIISPGASGSNSSPNEDIKAQIAATELQQNPNTEKINDQLFISIDKRLGEGRQGQVFVGIYIDERKTRHEVAVKRISKKNVIATNQQKRFSVERNILRKMGKETHKYICKFYYDTEDKDFYYFVFEHCKGGSLSDLHLERGRLDEKDAQILFSQLAQALNELKNIGIAHRDLKPDNIMISSDFEVKLVDFGMSRMRKKDAMEQTYFNQRNMDLESIAAKTQVGSPYYIAPEIWHNKQYDGTQSDLWSYGIILFYLITGHRPFNSDNLQNLGDIIVRGEFQWPDCIFVSPMCKDLICNLLIIDPKKRLNIEGILSHPWIDFKNKANLQKYRKEITCNDLHQNNYSIGKLVREKSKYEEEIDRIQREHKDQIIKKTQKLRDECEQLNDKLATQEQAHKAEKQLLLQQNYGK